MGGHKSQWVWVKAPEKVKLDAKAKERILEQVKKAVDCSDKLRKRVSRVAMRGNRVYLYHLVEQFISEGVVLLKPLIDGKYLEYPYARITVKNSDATICALDWQRHNDQWMTLFEGTLQECFASIENDGWWFE